MEIIPDRSEITAEFTWDRDSVYESDEEWRRTVDELSERVEELSNYEGSVTTDASTLLEAFELYETIFRDVETVTVYAEMRHSEDTRDQTAQAMSARAQAFATTARSKVSFLRREIQELTEQEFAEFAAEEPSLERYEVLIDDILRMKPHTRSTEVESLLADLSDVMSAPSAIYSTLTSADITFPTVEDEQNESIGITQNNFSTLLKRSDRGFRRRVYETYCGEWDELRHTIASAYSKQVTTNVKNAHARNYDTARKAALDGPNVPTEVYDTLVQTITDSLEPFHRHLRLKRGALKVDKLHMWDLHAPLMEEDVPEIPYEQACEHIVNAVEPLGETYRDRLADGLNDGWIDVYETAGKQWGAAHIGSYDTKPFVRLNYKGDVKSMYTFAHELGHAMHSVYSQESQPYIYTHYSTFIAEVASNVNEALLVHYLLETVDDVTLCASILDAYLERVRSMLYSQTMHAEFEHRVHELREAGEPLTADRIDELYRDLKTRYFSPAVVDDHATRQWMRISHFFNSFSVYQYATGISAALAIVEDILENGTEAATDYRSMLRRGGRGYPLDVLDAVDIDMHRSETIELAIEAYDSWLDELESIAT
ncbi:oligoendopeptidase F [Natrinema saccharevitans]|uniref:Oligoendopeptidase F n=1 Tax=Natrinema saccharevitans TaxID=301967 RepID=A0A1S8AW09_9EURY|nr:oligoendopeptidase F [Natrinema saccharevitans]OLZ40852.1 oligoendopeptidase F [Natrinema saccharevitans]